jgi:hypothetical protein
MYVINVAPAQKQPDAKLEPLEGPSLLPTALRDAGDDLRQLWLELADEVRHPVARARCWDIVFTLRLMRNRRDAAERAARAYLDAAATTLSRRRKADGLLRAWSMTRLVGLANLTGEITTAMTVLAEEAVTHREDPYAAITVLGALVARPPRGTPRIADPAVDDLLDRALTTYRQIEVIRDLALVVRRSAGSGTARAEHASRREVGAMLAEAKAATDPMIIRTLFNDAAAAARRLGLTDLEQVAVARLQAAPPLRWESAAYAITTPAAFFDHYLPGFSAAADWRSALAIWMHTGPPSGSSHVNEATARQALQTSVVHRLLSTTVLFRGRDLPARTLRSEEDSFNRELARAEAFHMDMNGRFLAKALHQIRHRFGIPSPRRPRGVPPRRRRGPHAGNSPGHGAAVVLGRGVRRQLPPGGAQGRGGGTYSTAAAERAALPCRGRRRRRPVSRPRQPPALVARQRLRPRLGTLPAHTTAQRRK